MVILRIINKEIFQRNSYKLAVLIFALYFLQGCFFNNAQKSNTRSTETPDGGLNTGVDGSPSVPPAQEMIVARLDMQTRHLEVYRHQMASGLENDQLKQALALKAGCSNETPSFPFQSAEASLKIANLMTEGFATGQTFIHPQDSKRLKIEYNALQFDNAWTFSYAFNNQTEKFVTAGPMPKINLIEITSAQKTQLNEAQLLTQEKEFVIDTNQDLKVAWNFSPISSENQTFIRLFIGTPGEEKTIYCNFDAKLMSAAIPQKFLLDLPIGKQTILVTLFNTQVVSRSNSPRWLLATYDWRSGRIEKR